jgi:hypothetical protein
MLQVVEPGNTAAVEKLILDKLAELADSGFTPLPESHDQTLHACRIHRPSLTTLVFFVVVSLSQSALQMLTLLGCMHRTSCP